MERTAGSAHNPNIEQKKAGVKKEQEKGCGSVNRPTPGSQRPVEPVDTGFSQGVKIQKIRGRFEGLGVKLWGVDAQFPQCRAISYGVRIGVVADFGHFFASRVAGSFLAHIAGVKPPKGGAIFLRPMWNIGVDISQPSRVVLVVEQNT